jgi:hypothetical protein
MSSSWSGKLTPIYEMLNFATKIHRARYFTQIPIQLNLDYILIFHLFKFRFNIILSYKTKPQT